MKERDETRGGLGGVAPIHLNIDSRILHGFRWIPTEDLLHHEKVRTERSKALMDYLDSGNVNVSPAILAIVCCSRTNTIIDGHHRATVLGEMGFSMSPVLFLDYGHYDILVSPEEGNTITKNDVIEAAQTGRVFEPKSTAHVVKAGDGSLHPIVSLSPNCSLGHGPTGGNLTGGWSYQPKMKRSPSRALEEEEK
eukprot:TRINITY_DN6558_c0_g1_i4.p1 TRINITY_DN6558_c0_g1~~TRINITY_DN6558_c0_g1_i4.p1  ORF type:complete len:194 (+),score=40.13 TRINITY_DN6558_c0_g1_i4:117-698(+)